MLESRGIKRSISVVLFLIGQAAPGFPALQPWVPLINSIASIFGVGGLAHAAIATKPN